jgi:phage-related protein
VNERSKIKTVVWIASTLKDLKTFPDDVKDVIGYALYQAQIGRKAPSAKPLSGFGGAGVLAIVEDHQTDTYRAVYTVKFADLIYMFSTLSRRNRKRVSLLRSLMLTSSGNG